MCAGVYLHTLEYCYVPIHATLYHAHVCLCEGVYLQPLEMCDVTILFPCTTPIYVCVRVFIYTRLNSAIFQYLPPCTTAMYNCMRVFICTR